MTRLPRFTLIHALVAGGAVAVIAGLLAPFVAHLPRERVGGRDQYQWAADLKSGDEGDRRAAAEALCEMLRRRPGRPPVRQSMSAMLVEAKAEEAVPALREMLAGDDEELRIVAERTIRGITEGGR